MNQQLLKTWYPLLKDELEQDYFISLKKSLMDEYTTQTVYPHPSNIFKAFEVTNLEDVKVVIIGQDPYPFGKHACGIALSSFEKETPASLRTVFREVDRDVIRTKNKEEFKKYFPNNDLTPWCNQGVLLLNACLTVRAEAPGSHDKFGWQKFTGKAIELLMSKKTPIVFASWGKSAENLILQNKEFKSDNHMFLTTGHPASGSHGKDIFSGCNHFSQINNYLTKQGLTPINWKLHE